MLVVWLVARNWWRGWWLGLFFQRFLDIFGRHGQEKSTKIANKVKTEEKIEKYQKNVGKVTCTFSFLEPQIHPKLTKNTENMVPKKS